MGKKAKEHRKKVAKRNQRISQQRYSAQNALTKMMEQMAKMQDEENLNVNAGGKEIPFEFIAEPESSGIKGFEVSDEPEFDSAGFSIEDREEIRNVFPANVEGSDEFNQANNE